MAIRSFDFVKLLNVAGVCLLNSLLSVVGKRKGDKVTVMAPAGKMGYEIVEID